MTKRKPNKPNIIDKDSAEFRQLQRKWYDKLKSKGFDDIEWTDHRTSRGHNTSYLKRAAFNVKQRYNPNIENHFRLCRNFLTHYKWRRVPKYGIYKFIFTLYCDGLSYRDMVKRLKTSRYKRTVSVFFMFNHINRLIVECYEWNKTDSEGMLVERQVLFEGLKLV